MVHNTSAHNVHENQVRYAKDGYTCQRIVVFFEEEGMMMGPNPNTPDGYWNIYDNVLFYNDEWIILPKSDIFCGVKSKLEPKHH